MSFLTPLCVMALCVLSVFSQAPEPKPGMNSPARRDAPVITTYDKFEDRTSVFADIRPAKISDPSSNSTLQPVHLSAEFGCQGRSVKCPAASVVFAYPAGSRSLALCHDMDVIFVADGV